MEGAEFLDTLAGLMAMDYVVANKVNIRTMDEVKKLLPRQSCLRS